MSRLYNVMYWGAAVFSALVIRFNVAKGPYTTANWGYCYTENIPYVLFIILFNFHHFHVRVRVVAFPIRRYLLPSVFDNFWKRTNFPLTFAPRSNNETKLIYISQTFGNLYSLKFISRVRLLILMRLLKFPFADY